MVENGMIEWAMSQGVATVFAIVVLYMIKDMVDRLNKMLERVIDELIECKKHKINQDDSRSEES